MLGKKRRNVSFSSKSDANPFQNKKVVPQFAFGGQASATAELTVGAAPSLDRRKAARQHVRALNTEFASWVQSQLQDHPDELWEDGVKDYLTNTSDILGKFADVVKWLETNTGSEGRVSTLVAVNTEKNNGPETISKETPVPVKSVSDMSSNIVGRTSPSISGGFGTPTAVHSTTAGSAPSWSFGLSASSQALSQSSSAGLATSWSPGVFSTSSSLSTKTVDSSSSPSAGIAFSNQTTSPMSASGFMSSTTPGLFSTSFTSSFATPSFTPPLSAGAFVSSQTTFSFGGTQASMPATVASEGADEDEEPEQPCSPSVKKAEEKGIIVVHETKCKLYVKSTSSAEKEPWKDKGVGQLFIKCEEGASKGTKESKPRVLVRNDVGRIMLNASLYTGIKTNLTKNAIVAIFHTLDESAGEGGSGGAVARTFLIKLKNEEERNKLADAIREHAPAA